jgi:hypothetical protein
MGGAQATRFLRNDGNVKQEKGTLSQNAGAHGGDARMHYPTPATVWISAVSPPWSTCPARRINGLGLSLVPAVARVHRPQVAVWGSEQGCHIVLRTPPSAAAMLS